MSSQAGRQYDSDAFEGVQMMHIGTGLTGTLLGTVASDAAGVEIFKAPTGLYGRILGAEVKFTNGGTGAGAATEPSLAVVVSLAGTGDAVSAATIVYGAGRADNTYGFLSPVTSGSANEFGPGDVISTRYIAGTVNDTSMVFALQTILWQERAV